MYMLVLLKWNDIILSNQTWQDFNVHFTQVYNVCLVTCGAEGGQYHNAVNTVANKDLSIITQTYVAMHHAKCKHVGDQ